VIEKFPVVCTYPTCAASQSRQIDHTRTDSVFLIINPFPVHPRQHERKWPDSWRSVISVVKRLIKFRLRNEIGEYRMVKGGRRPRRPVLIYFFGCATPLDGILYCEWYMYMVMDDAASKNLLNLSNHSNFINAELLITIHAVQTRITGMQHQLSLAIASADLRVFS